MVERQDIARKKENTSTKKENTSKKGNDIKSRSWTFIIYEDSTDIEDFKLKISDLARTGLCALYALHDKDIRANGEQKKPHYHVILMWDSPTTYNNALNTAKSVAPVVEYVEAIRSLVGSVRYLTHLDDADKYQYDKDIVHTVGNVDYDSLIESSRNDRIEVAAMAQYIRDNNITHFDNFAFYCMENAPEWFRIISERNTFFFKNLIQSQHFRLKEESQTLGHVIRIIDNKFVNVRTGEIVGEVEETK